jgi:hypothetical protein
MIRIAVCGDRHVDRRHPAYTESLRCWDAAIDDAIAQGVHGFIGLGDVMEIGVNTADLTEISYRYARMLDQGWVCEVQGNHEPHQGLRWIEPLTKQRMIIADEGIKIEPLLLRSGDLDPLEAVALLIPYCRRGVVSLPEGDEMTLAEFYAAAAAKVGEMVAEAKATFGPDMPLIIAGHWTPAGFEVGPSELELTASKEMIVPLELLAPADLVLVGHIHRAQQIGNVVGVGSMFRTTFAERDQEKSYVIVTIDDGAVSWERRVIPTRPMKELHISGARVAETVGSIIAGDPDQDIKLVIETTPDDKTVYADLLAPLDALPGRFPWEVIRPSIAVTRAPEIEQSVTLANDFDVWLTLAYPDLSPTRRAAVIEKVESL